MSAKHTPGPWHIGGISNPNTDPRYSIWGPTPEGAQSGEWIAKDVTPANAHPIAAAPELLEDAKSTDQGYDWFRDELLAFRNYFGSQTVTQTEAFIDSLIAHLDSRQIGTRRAIARAEGGQP